MGDYWRVLWDAGKLTREKMAKFQNPITATPLYLPHIINGESTLHVSLASCRALVLLTALLPNCRFFTWRQCIIESHMLRAATYPALLPSA